MIRPSVKLTCWNNRMSISGRSQVSSLMTNAERLTPAITNRPMMTPESNQSSVCPSPSAAVSAPTPRMQKIIAG